MTLTISPPSSATGQLRRPQTAAAPARTKHGSTRSELGMLGSYRDSQVRLRQVVALPGARGSVLVVDRDASTLTDRRLVAHLAADEPVENAALVCEHYLRDPAGRWCRRVSPEDLEAAPFAEADQLDLDAQKTLQDTSALTDNHGRTYSLERGPSEPGSKRGSSESGSQLRWCRRSPATRWTVAESISMREAIAGLESYEPVRTLTDRALAAQREDSEVSISMLRAERARMEASQIVLNRGLRRAALARTATQDLSMSEIAVRCGKVKRDRNGRESGETSWLARRLGISPEGGKSAPTPWIHTDVLALIARHGLGISPREVELG